MTAGTKKTDHMTRPVLGRVLVLTGEQMDGHKPAPWEQEAPIPSQTDSIATFKQQRAF